MTLNIPLSMFRPATTVTNKSNKDALTIFGDFYNCVAKTEECLKRIDIYTKKTINAKTSNDFSHFYWSINILHFNDEYAFRSL